MNTIEMLCQNGIAGAIAKATDNQLLDNVNLINLVDLAKVVDQLQRTGMPAFTINMVLDKTYRREFSVDGNGYYDVKIWVLHKDIVHVMFFLMSFLHDQNGCGMGDVKDPTNEHGRIIDISWH